jgi:hypothetical protein
MSPKSAAAIAVALLAVGCRSQEVTHVRVAKAAVEAPAAEDLAPATPAGALVWKLPKGWTQSVAGGMRYATLNGPDVEVSVVVLPGTAGGELANVNRWRGQLGLPPMDEAAAAAQRKQVKTQAGPFALYDFAAEGAGAKQTRMIAALSSASGNTWFFKMLGNARAVGAAQADFIRLVEGLRADETN